MAFGWYRIKIRGFEFPGEAAQWEKLLRDEVLPFLARLEESGTIVRFFFLNEPGSADGTKPNHTMIVFFGQIDKVMDELWISSLYGRLVETGPPEHPLYEPYDLERRGGRFGPHHMLGITLLELGSRFAVASRLGHEPKDENSRILHALRHAFCNGLLMPALPLGDALYPELDPLLDQVYEILTRAYPNAWTMIPPAT